MLIRKGDLVRVNRFSDAGSLIGRVGIVRAFKVSSAGDCAWVFIDNRMRLLRLSAIDIISSIGETNAL